MKISIWRQFSSNHSNDFAIVGRFKSVADAQSAAEELRTLLKSISAWYEAHPANESFRYSDKKYTPTDVERRIAAHYDIEWPNSPEWLIGWSNPEEAVVMIDECVFLDSPLSGVGYDPFDKILKKMGAEVVNAEQEMGEMRIFVNISATAPDAQVAKKLADKIQTHLDADYAYFHPGGGYFTGITQRPSPPWAFDDSDTSPLVLGNFEKVTVSDAHLQIDNLWFSKHLGNGLTALVSWLRAEGCEVSWEFREDKYPEGD